MTKVDVLCVVCVYQKSAKTLVMRKQMVKNGAIEREGEGEPALSLSLR